MLLLDELWSSSPPILETCDLSCDVQLTCFIWRSCSHFRKYAATSEFSFYSRNGTWSRRLGNCDEWKATCRTMAPQRRKEQEWGWEVIDSLRCPRRAKV